MKNAKCKLQNEASGNSARRAELLHSEFCILHSGGRRRAFTLVELLVVIAILSIVTVASIPFVIPALNSRAVREAARIVNTQFAAAQAQAMATGRSVGVWMERLPSEPTGSMDLYLAEFPPPYGGQTVDEICTVDVSTNPGKVTLAAGFYPLLRPGDLIRFNHTGPYYILSEAQGKNSVPDPNDSSALVLNNTDLTKTIMYLPTDNHFRMPPAAYSGTWQPTFEVFRQPMKSSASAVQLPTGAVIDLIDSGVGNPPGTAPVGNKLLYQSIPNNVWNVNPGTATPQQIGDDQIQLFTVDPTTSKPNTRPIVFIFNSSGEMDSVCFNITNPTPHGGSIQTTAPVPMTSPVYLMIGKREKLFQKDSSSGKYDAAYYSPADNASTQAEKHNFRDLENLWIAINPQSGLATTAEVKDLPADPSGTQNPDQYAASLLTSPTTHDTLANAVNLSRQFAQSAQATGGR